jgi:hypothetical protein
LFLSGWVYEEGVNRAILCRALKILPVFNKIKKAKVVLVCFFALCYLLNSPLGGREKYFSGIP